MTRIAIAPILTTHRLRRAQALHMSLEAGTVLRVGAGRVRLREPMRWLGDGMTAPVVTLSEGEAHRLEAGGWVQIEALHREALVHRQAPVPSWQAALAALKRGMRRMGRWQRSPVLQRRAPLR